MGDSRQPMSSTQQVDREKLRKVLHCLLADFGYVQPPAEGCPVRRNSEKERELSQIVGGVVEELRRRGVL